MGAVQLTHSFWNCSSVSRRHTRLLSVQDDLFAALQLERHVPVLAAIYLYRYRRSADEMTRASTDCHAEATKTRCM